MRKPLLNHFQCNKWGIDASPLPSRSNFENTIVVLWSLDHCANEPTPVSKKDRKSPDRYDRRVAVVVEREDQVGLGAIEIVAERSEILVDRRKKNETRRSVHGVL